MYSKLKHCIRLVYRVEILIFSALFIQLLYERFFVVFQERDKSSISRFMVIIVHLIALAARVATTTTTTTATTTTTTDSSLNVQRLRSAVQSVIRMNPRGASRRTPLHLACSSDTTDVGRYPVARFPDPAAIRALLEAGADIDAFDCDRNTPLHQAARCSSTTATTTTARNEVILLLLERGAHPDIRNSHGETPLQLLQDTTTTTTLPIARYQTLQCLAARAITKHAINYAGHVPRRLEAFILLH